MESFHPEPNDSERYVRETQMARLRTLEEQLGFPGTEAMRALEQKIMEDPMNVAPLFTQWHIEGENYIEEITDHESFQRAQIAFIIAQARIYRALDLVDECYEEIGDAIEYATRVGLQDVVDALLEVGST